MSPRKVRIIPSPDGTPGFVVHPDDRPVRKLPTTKPTEEPPPSGKEDPNGMP